MHNALRSRFQCRFAAGGACCCQASSVRISTPSLRIRILRSCSEVDSPAVNALLAAPLCSPLPFGDRSRALPLSVIEPNLAVGRPQINPPPLHLLPPPIPAHQPLEMLQQVLLPRLPEHQPVDRETALEPPELALLAAEGDHGHAALDLGAAVHLVDPEGR